MSIVVRILSWLGKVAAVLFLVVLASGAALFFSGRLTRKNLPEIWAVMSGSKRAVPQADYQRWKQLEDDAKPKTMVESEERKGSGTAHVRFQKRRSHYEREFEKERAVLSILDEMILQRQTTFNKNLQAFKAQEKAFLDKKKVEEDAEKQANLKRLLKLYQGMEPELIAEDFQAKWGSTKSEKDEVVDLLRRMPARLSSEVINAIANSSLRVEIMKEIRKS